MMEVTLNIKTFTRSQGALSEKLNVAVVYPVVILRPLLVFGQLSRPEKAAIINMTHMRI